MMAKPTPSLATRQPASPDSTLVSVANPTPVAPRPARAACLARAAGIILAAAVPAVGAADVARAGAVLVSRESYIHAAGGPASGSAAGTGTFAPFDLSNGTTGFDRFADGVSNVGQDADPAQATGGP